MRFSHALVLLALAFLAPACGKTKKNSPPSVLAVLPAPGASSGIGLMPNILVQFDRAMDAASVQDTNNWAFSKQGAVSGLTITVEYLPELEQARIIPQQLLLVNTTYGVVIGSGIKSAEGVQIGGSALFVFDTTSLTSTTSIITWSGATVAASPPTGQIVLTWSSAQESSVTPPPPLSDIAATYDVYLSTTSGGENLMVAPATTTTPTSSTGTTITGLTAGATYYIKVQPRDGAGAVFTALTELTAVAGP
ncbi:MAG TPA: Ig-like domain-containing protein [Planctomycetota bacterium]|nr:Ig-like domain-containing protein [Planctomycetota bacterium]